jgi:hypothetical protein
MLSIQIPKFFLPGFKQLSNRTTEQVQKIAAFLEKVPIGTGAETFEKLFIDNFQEWGNAGIASTIFSLASFTNSDVNKLDHQQLAEKLAHSYVEQSDEKGRDVLETLIANLITLLNSIGQLSATFKVFSLLSENGKTFKSSHIVTDIRLVFSENLENKNRHALLIHHLKISAEVNDETKEYFFSLDTADLRKLKEQIERAEKKDHIIREQYGDMSFITVTE